MANNVAKQNRRNTFFVIALLAVLLGAGIFMYARFTSEQADSRMVQIPAIHTSLRSEDGGLGTVFGARVVLEVDRSTGFVNTQQMYTEIRTAIDSLTIEDISGFDGTNIMRAAIQERIAGYFDDGELIAVLFTDIVSDIPMRRDTDRSNPIFDAIFAPR